MDGKPEGAITADVRNFVTGLLIGTAIVLVGFLLF